MMDVRPVREEVHVLIYVPGKVLSSSTWYVAPCSSSDRDASIHTTDLRVHVPQHRVLATEATTSLVVPGVQHHLAIRILILLETLPFVQEPGDIVLFDKVVAAALTPLSLSTLPSRLNPQRPSPFTALRYVVDRIREPLALRIQEGRNRTPRTRTSCVSRILPSTQGRASTRASGRLQRREY